MLTSAQTGMVKGVSDFWTSSEVRRCVMLSKLLLVVSSGHHIWQMSHLCNMNIHLVCPIEVGKMCILKYLFNPFNVSVTFTIVL